VTFRDPDPFPETAASAANGNGVKCVGLCMHMVIYMLLEMAWKQITFVKSNCKYIIAHYYDVFIDVLSAG
jgi:hypothetical protein